MAEKVRVIYGGSVNTKNVDNFLNLDILDGFLVGAASISMFDFLPIIRNVYEKQS
ncbi:MAG: triose-phosphate isomerase [Candidatus Moraniibacteriota bacterium]